MKMLQLVWSLDFWYVSMWPRCARKITQNSVKPVKGRHSKGKKKKKSWSVEFSIMVPKSGKEN